MAPLVTGNGGVKRLLARLAALLARLRSRTRRIPRSETRNTSRPFWSITVAAADFLHAMETLALVPGAARARIYYDGREATFSRRGKYGAASITKDAEGPEAGTVAIPWRYFRGYLMEPPNDDRVEISVTPTVLRIGRVGIRRFRFELGLNFAPTQSEADSSAGNPSPATPNL